MILYVILVLVVVEAGAFAIATLLHLGVTIFGLRDSYDVAEGIVQGNVGLLLAISAYGIWKRTTWARAVGFVVHGIGLIGALFGMLVATRSGASLDLEPFDWARLATLVAVPILLFMPAARAAFQPYRR